MGKNSKKGRGKGKGKGQASSSSPIAPIAGDTSVAPTPIAPIAGDTSVAPTVEVAKRIMRSEVIREGFSKIEILMKKLKVAHENLVSEYHLQEEEAIKNANILARLDDEVTNMEEAVAKMKEAPVSYKIRKSFQSFEEIIQKRFAETMSDLFSSKAKKEEKDEKVLKEEEEKEKNLAKEEEEKEKKVAKGEEEENIQMEEEKEEENIQMEEEKKEENIQMEEEKKEQIAEDVKENILSSMPQGSERDDLAYNVASKVIDNMSDGFVKMIDIIKEMHDANEKLAVDYFAMQEVNKKHVKRIIEAEEKKVNLYAEIEKLGGKQ